MLLLLQHCYCSAFRTMKITAPIYLFIYLFFPSICSFYLCVCVCVTGGTGMDLFGRRFPKRTYDVGIAEQHAVTFAAGMAVEGLKPFCCIYSTFMQRAYDQVCGQKW